MAKLLPRWPIILTAAVLAIVGTGTVSAQNGITDIGGFVGYRSSQPLGISGDGNVVVGILNDIVPGHPIRGFRWTERTRFLVVGSGTSSYATGVNSDGSVVVGYANNGPGGVWRAFRWTAGYSETSLGVLNGGGSSGARGVSADGSVVVGDADDGAAGGAARAFRWTQGSGMVSLGVLNAGTSSFARGVNADGSVIVGEAWDGAAGNMPRAFRWTQGSGIVSLGILPTGTYSSATAVSVNGAVVVGYADDTAAGGALRAFRWTQGSGMVSLGTLGGGTESKAFATNADGSVIVGMSSDGAAGNTPRAFRWTQASSMQKVEDWLRAGGVNIPADITLSAYGTSSDGNVVTGMLAAGTAFIARVSPIGMGLVTLADVQQSLQVGQYGATMALSSANTLLNGAHSRPLSRRVAPDKSTLWIAGDWGRDDHGARNGNLGSAEAGVGRNFGPVQLNVSMGETWARQNLVVGGHAKTDGTYVLAEALIPVSGNLWAVFNGYSQWGEADLRRGYLNAGLPDASTGRPSIRTWGVRARFEWDKAVSFADAEIAPYADLAYSKATLDGYTETGGGFPARFDERKDKATDLRLGFNAVRPVSPDVQLVSTLEAVHRFEPSGARTTGNLIGLFSFDLAAPAYQRNWLRAGVGIEGKLGEGIASLMLNATTQGEAPNFWIAASLRMAF